MLDYLKEQHIWKVLCQFVRMMSGVQFVIVVGMQQMLLWSADNLDYQ